MQWLWKLFGRAPAGDNPATGTVPSERPSPVDGNFQPAPWVYEQALDRVLEETAGLDSAREQLLGALLQTAAQGPSAQEAAVGECLSGLRWSWPTLSEWAEHFFSRGYWPTTWRRYPSLLLPHRSPPRSPAEAVQYFSYLELRDILKPSWPRSLPFPIKLEELQGAFVEYARWDVVRTTALEKFRLHQEEARNREERDRAGLLAYHLHAAAVSRVTYLQWETIGANRFLSYELEVVCDDDEMASSPFRDRFNAGQKDLIPPFFPGDCARLRLSRQL
jgi:hypothetical protein